MTEHDELLLATMHARDQSLADLIVLCIGLAAERHPELIRTALAKVFDLKAVAEQYERAATIASETMRVAQEGVELVRGLILDLDRVERRQDSLKADRELLLRQLGGIMKLLKAKAGAT